MSKNYLSLISHQPVTTQPLNTPIISSDANGFSDLVYIGGSSLVGMFIPGSNSGAAWTTANIAIYAALPNGSQTNEANYGPLYREDGSQYVLTIPSTIPATGLIIQVNPYDFVGIDSIQLQSVNQASSSTAVAQTNSPVITLITIGNGTF